MAQYNEILVGRFNQLLTRLFGMKGGAPSPQLAAEIQPVISIGELSGDLHYLADERMAGAFGAQGAVAAELSHVALVNPPTSGVIATVEAISLQSASAVQVYLGIFRVSGMSVTSYGSFRDSRPTGKPSVGLNIGHQAGSLVSGLVGGHMGVVAGGLDRLVTPEWVVHPGAALVMETTAVNLPITACFYWTEHPITRSEIS